MTQLCVDCGLPVDTRDNPSATTQKSITLLWAAANTPRMLPSSKKSKKSKETSEFAEALVVSLLEKGADANATEKSNGCTAMHQAAFKGKEEILRVLVERGGADPAVAALSSSWEMTPLHKAAWNGHCGAMSIIVRAAGAAGAEALLMARTSCLEEEDATALHVVASQGDAEGVRTLLELAEEAGVAKKLLGARDAAGQTARDVALAEEGSEEAAKALAAFQPKG